MTDPWADPSSPGTPYGGPPQTTPPVHGQPGPYPGWPAYAPYPGYSAYPSPYPSPYPGHGVPYGYPGPYGHPGPWGPMPPAGPRRPGQVVAAAVLAFVQAALVLLASVYVYFFASIARVAVLDAGGSVGEVDELANEGSVLALIQVLSVVALVVGGVLALGRRRRQAYPVFVGALALQVVLAVYWAVRLSVIGNDLPGPDPATVFTWFSLFFAAMPVVALGLVLVGAGRHWFQQQSGGVPAGPV